MSSKIILDTERILEVSKKINNTSSEISNSILSLRKLSNDLTTGINDQNLNSFKLSFDDYISKLSSLVTFYNNITTNINYLVKEYDSVDSTDASELKDAVNNEANV